jgi:nickel transport protein
MKRLTILILMVAWVPALGHDLWIERTADGLVLCYGHGRSHHEGAKLIDYRPEMVVRADCFDSEGNRLEAPVSGESPVRFSGGCASVCVLTSTGYWSKTPQGTKNASKKEARDAVRTWRSFESVKRIDAWGDALSRPLTSDFEITPLEDPLALSPGGKIRVLVTLEGAPVEGATVTYDGEARAVTGKDGRANLKMRHGGFQVVQAGLTVPLQSEDADETVYTANLNFEIGGPK